MSNLEVTLPSGFSIPAVGFGTWQATDEVIEAALDNALQVGYRHIDTAAAYNNEEAIGRVLKKWIDSGKLKREDIFITTKLPIWNNRPEDVSKTLAGSLERLQLSYVDLYLIHLPIAVFKTDDGKLICDNSTDHVAVWKEMEKQVDAGKTKYIGVSNFNKKQVGRILDNSRIKPVTNQVELHAHLQQFDLVDYLNKNNVTITAYSSLGTPGSAEMFPKVWGTELKVPNLLQDPVVVAIAQKNNKTPAQVLLRHIVQRGIIVIPKSTNPDRIKQNFEIQDWSLDAEDIAKLNALNRDERILEFGRFIPGASEHPEYPF